MNRTITIIVTPDGKTKIETHGYTGSPCRDASRFLEDALGFGTVERLKDEYFLEDNHNLQHKETIQC
ncbi:MAG: DUF2997 domain-containing protein [Planctomycetaceae bacterium]|nr:DUF2997 domain-containing protein [Planctomycetaceae bacterium]